MTSSRTHVSLTKLSLGPTALAALTLAATLAASPAHAGTIVLSGGTGGTGAFGGAGGNGGNGETVNGPGMIYEADSGTTFVGGTGGNGGSGGNGGNGLDAQAGTFYITGGSFSGGTGGEGGSGGNGGSALHTESGTVIYITGGTFSAGSGGVGGAAGGSGSGLFVDGGDITVYGTDFSSTGALTGSGSSSGLLDNNTTPETIAYHINSGSITLSSGMPPAHASPAPEPSQLGVLAIPSVGLAGLILRARKRNRAA